MMTLTMEFLRFSGEPEIANLSADEALDEFLAERDIASNDPAVVCMVNELMASELI